MVEQNPLFLVTFFLSFCNFGRNTYLIGQNFCRSDQQIRSSLSKTIFRHLGRFFCPPPHKCWRICVISTNFLLQSLVTFWGQKICLPEVTKLCSKKILEITHILQHFDPFMGGGKKVFPELRFSSCLEKC